MVLAQVPDPTGEAAAIITLVGQIGLSAVFLWQWRIERAERQELQKTIMSFIERFGPALENSTSTLERVQASMATQVEKAAVVPDSRIFDLSMRRLELTVDELSQALRESRRRKDEL